ncbi:MAG: DUF3846 domain-containing protein [Bacteroides sp.]|nr:DUF3846 domain-containing protein [Bacteroides sp.]
MEANKQKAVALWIKSDGTIVKVDAQNGKDFSLDELQGFVEGYIEIVHLTDEYVMVVNEEGKLIGLPLNEDATCMLEKLGIVNYIVGDVIVCRSVYIK